MPVLSAKYLTEDAAGCSRLRAVIASDPGYAARAEEAASGLAKPFVTRRAPIGASHAEGQTACASQTAVPAPFHRVMRAAPSQRRLALTSGLVNLVVCAPLLVAALAFGRPVL